MKFMLLALAVPLIIGCRSDYRPGKIEIDGGSYVTEVVGECEYLVSTSDKAITHKGDCKNPVHVYNRIDKRVIPATIKE